MKKVIQILIIIIVSIQIGLTVYGQECPGNQGTIQVLNGEKISANEFTFEVWLANTGITANTFTGCLGGLIGLPSGMTGTFTVVEQPSTLGFTGWNQLIPNYNQTAGSGSVPIIRWNNVAIAYPGLPMPMVMTKFAKFRFVRTGGTQMPTGLTLFWQPFPAPNNPQINSYCSGNPVAQVLSQANGSLIALEGTLALRLISFEAQKYERGSNKITWVTSSEANAIYYDIERSSNGHKWETIGRMESVGKTNKEQAYAYVDQYSLKYTSPKVLYYRLKMVDYDGRKEYSEIRAVIYEKGDDLMVLYPNPTTKSVKLDLTGIGHNGDQLELSLIDSQGRLVLQKTIEGVDSYELDVAGIPANVYQVQVTRGDKVYQTKLVKVD